MASSGALRTGFQEYLEVGITWREREACAQCHGLGLALFVRSRYEANSLRHQ